MNVNDAIQSVVNSVRHQLGTEVSANEHTVLDDGKAIGIKLTLADNRAATTMVDLRSGEAGVDEAITLLVDTLTRNS